MKKACLCFLVCLLFFSTVTPAFASVRGDVNGDGALTAADARCALRRAVSLETFEPGSGRFLAADANGNGVVGADDARMLLRASVGLHEPLLENEAEDETVDPAFSEAMLVFSASLLRQLTENADGNVLLSPLSVASALAMTANGAAGDTLSELTALLGCGDRAALCRQIRAQTDALANDSYFSLKTANSVWVNSPAQPLLRQTFLNDNIRWFGAGVNVYPFGPAAVRLINAWVQEQTDGMIDSILDSLDPAALIVLLNALSLEAKWAVPFREEQTRDALFYPENGAPVPVRMMSGGAPVWLENDRAVGFVLPYAGGELSFAAIVPKDGVTLPELIAGTDGAALSALLAGGMEENVSIRMPKFSFSYETSLRRALSALGAGKMFDHAGADFSAMFAPPASPCIDDVIHKTFIEVNSEGTRAAAVTAVISKNAVAFHGEKEIVLDRPFLFAITAGASHTPVFIGTLYDPTEA